MLDEYAVLRWETEGGASRDRSEPLQRERRGCEGGGRAHGPRREARLRQPDSLRRRPARLCG